MVLQLDVWIQLKHDRAFLHQWMHVCKCECMLVSGGCGFYYMSICHNLPTKPQPFEKNSIYYSVTTKSNWLLNLTCAWFYPVRCVRLFLFPSRYACYLDLCYCSEFPEVSDVGKLVEKSLPTFTSATLALPSLPSNVLCTKPNFQFCRFLSLSMTKTSSLTTIGLDVFHWNCLSCAKYSLYHRPFKCWLTFST